MLGELYHELQFLSRVTFKNCQSLENVLLPEGLISIGSGAFDGCDALKEIILPESLQKMGVGVFTAAEMIVYAYIKESEQPALWLEGWHNGNVRVVWEYVEPDLEEDETQDESIKKGK